MPQFDIFSFHSQLFWVFFCFFFLYLFFSYCLLPALSTILKVRKFMLSKTPVVSDVTLDSARSSHFNAFNVQRLVTFTTDLESTSSTLKSSNLVTSWFRTGIFSHLASRVFCLNFFTKIQTPSFYY